MPATFACAVIELFRREKKLKSYRKNRLYRKFFLRSVMSAFVAAGATWVSLVHFDTFGLVFFEAYVLILLLLAEIDNRIMLLPDILTIPLLLLGVWASSLDMGLVSVTESALGAIVGYFFPTVVSFLVVWYRKDAFGGGDVKLLSAIGAWLGVDGLLYVILVASLMGIIYALLKKRSMLAFGPMIAMAGIVIAICFF